MCEYQQNTDIGSILCGYISVSVLLVIYTAKKIIYDCYKISLLSLKMFDLLNQISVLLK